MAGRESGRARVLVVATSGAEPADRDELVRAIEADAAPAMIFAEDALGGTSIDERAPGRLLARLPTPLALAAEVWQRRGDHDVVLSWGEPLAFSVAALMALTPRRRLRHMAILMWPFDASSPSKPKRALKRGLFPILARRGIDRLIVPAPLQRRLVVERWGVPAERLVPAQWMVDTRFWRPLDGPQDTICSVGREMRDYATLVAALDGLDIPCHVAPGTGALGGAMGTEDARAANVSALGLPPNLTVGALSPVELRALYARSRLVVVPILPSDSDNGVTSITEAMAMGRAVITTATAGRADILEDGANCVLVPPQDPEALRAAIRALWDDPERCTELGTEGRRRIEAAHGIGQWLDAVRAAARSLAPR